MGVGHGEQVGVAEDCTVAPAIGSELEHVGEARHQGGDRSVDDVPEESLAEVLVVGARDLGVKQRLLGDDQAVDRPHHAEPLLVEALHRITARRCTRAPTHRRLPLSWAGHRYTNPTGETRRNAIAYSSSMRAGSESRSAAISFKRSCIARVSAS